MPPRRGTKHIASVATRGAQWRRREPEATVLYRTVLAEWRTFVQRVEAGERVVPRFCRREVESVLRCGVLGCGFSRVHCDACKKDSVVAFSCKGRGFCPSCGTRRMGDTAAWLVDRVLPAVPVRQWVLSLTQSQQCTRAKNAAASRSQNRGTTRPNAATR